MPSFFVNRSLSRGDLTLFLSNGSGLPQDGFDVRWTVYRKDGRAASGLSIPATRAGTGEYFAPWGCAKAGGCYSVKWEYGVAPGAIRQSFCQEFFVLEGDGCRSSCCSRSPAGSPSTIDCGAFYSGQVLGPGDLCLQVLDDDGLPAQAFLVFWTLFNSRGCPVTPRTQAPAGGILGDYCVSWTACGRGDMTVKWEWMLDSDSPMETVCSSFSVVPPPAVLSRCWISTSVQGPCPPVFIDCGSPGLPMSSPNCEVQVPNPNCRPSPPPQVIVVNGCCDDASGGVPRTVILASQVLPVGGQFTNQSPFSLPPATKHVSFYIKYTRGLPGGFPVMRLMWGNGVEETQSTVINASFTSFDGRLSTQQMRLTDLLGPIPDDDNPEIFLLESSVPGGSTTVRVLLAEGGIIGVPGTGEVIITGAG